jgi:hypothetical protein
MFGKKYSEWSDLLQGKTHIAFSDFDNSELAGMPYVCMKEYKGRFGIISADDIRNKNIVIIDREDSTEYSFDSIDDMLASGWVVD